MNYILIIPYPQSHDSYHFEEGGSVSKMQNRYDASYTDYAWMDLLVGTVIATALRIVKWPKPSLCQTPIYFISLGKASKKSKHLQT